MEDFVSVSSFNVNGKVYELFAVFDGHGGKDARTGIKKGGKQRQRFSLFCLQKLIIYFLKEIKSQKSVLVIYQK